MKNKLINAAIALVSAFIGVALYTSIFESPCSYRHSFDKASELPIVRVAGNKTMAHSHSDDFIEAVKKTTPAVVHIKSLDYYSSQEFWGEETENEVKDQVDGSGVIISPQGYIVTTAHVVRNADNVEVSLTNKQRYIAEVVGVDDMTDIALLKIKANNLPFIKMGDSDALEVGQWVLAVGNPFKLSSTVTAGIISAKARELDFVGENNEWETYIQTDAAVNKGSSGGALVNTAGELIGINTAIATTSGQFQGYSFAIPSNVVNNIVNDLRNIGRVRRAYLGILMQDVSSQSDKQRNGIMVIGINENSPASNSDLQAGDIIRSINGYEVGNIAQLRNRLIQLDPGRVINISLIRKGASQFTQLILSDAGAQSEKDDYQVDKVEALLGATFAIPSADHLKNAYLDFGIQVKSLTKGLIKTKTAIQKDFIIYQINNEPVERLEDFNQIIEKLKKGESITFKGRYPGTKKDRLYAFSL